MNHAQPNSVHYLAQKQETVDADTPNPAVSIDHTLQHVYDFTYLHDNHLSRVFDFCVPNSVGNVAIPVYVCIYDIVRTCSIELEENGKVQKVNMPFLKFLVKPKSNEITLPSFEYMCNSASSEDNETLFRNMCLTNVLEITGSKEQFGSSFETMYDTAFKGMLYHDGAVLVVFDYDDIQTHFVQPETHMWAIVDELVFTTNIAGVPVDSRVVEIFRKNELLWNIAYSGGYVDFPHILYSVVNASNTGVPSWKNELVEPTTDTSSEAVLRKSSLMIGQKTDDYVCGTTDGSKYGDRYLFSVYPIIAETLAQCRRYAVFVVGANYVLDKTFHAKYMEKHVPVNQTAGAEDDEEDNDTLDELVPTIYFVETTSAATIMW